MFCRQNFLTRSLLNFSGVNRCTWFYNIVGRKEIDKVISTPRGAHNSLTKRIDKNGYRRYLLAGWGTPRYGVLPRSFLLQKEAIAKVCSEDGMKRLDVIKGNTFSEICR